MRSLPLLLLPLALGAAVLLAPAASSASSASAWYPLEAGETHRFRLERTRTLRAGGSVRSRNLLVGESVISVVGRVSSDEEARSARPRWRVRQVDLERQPRLLEERKPSRSRESFVYSMRDGTMRLHEHAEESATHRYAPPLPLLRAPLREGQRWELGTLNVGGLELELEVEVAGREALSVEGRRYESALHVQYTGSVSGALRGESGEQTVRNGHYERNLWLVRGLGPVRDVVEIDLELEGSDGERLGISDVTTRTRLSDEGGASAGTAASRP